MATLETRDFLRMLDHHFPAHPHSSSSSSSSSFPLHFTLRATESDCSNNAERVCEEEATTTYAAMNDTSAAFKRKRSAVDQIFVHGGNMFALHNISPLAVVTAPLLRDSMTCLRIPLARKASLVRFFQKRNERVRKLRLNGRNCSSDRSATLLIQAKSERKSEAAIPSDITELELHVPSVKRQCLESFEAQ